jgi:hypothetical protein
VTRSGASSDFYRGEVEALQRQRHFFGSFLYWRILIYPDPKKDRLTETIIARPFREFDLADQFRPNPMTTSHLSRGQPLIPTVATGGWHIVR